METISLDPEEMALLPSTRRLIDAVNGGVDLQEVVNAFALLEMRVAVLEDHATPRQGEELEKDL